MFYIVALLIFAVDFAIKRIADTYLAPVGSLPIIKNVYHFTYVKNTGVAFGMFQNQRPLLIFIGVLVCALVYYFYLRTGQGDIYLRFCLAMVFGGSLGNLYDRIFYGYVVDMFDFRFFPVFNFADVAINVGVFLILLAMVFGRIESSK